MILLTIDFIPGEEFEVLGLANGTIVQSKNIGRDFKDCLHNEQANKRKWFITTHLLFVEAVGIGDCRRFVQSIHGRGNQEDKRHRM